MKGCLMMVFAKYTSAVFKRASPWEVLLSLQILRTKTKNRALRKMEKLKKELAKGLVPGKHFRQVQASYLGLLKYCRGRKIGKKLALDQKL